MAAGDPGGFPVVSPWRKPPRIISTRRHSDLFGSTRRWGLRPARPGFLRGNLSGLVTPGGIPRRDSPLLSTSRESRLASTHFSFVAAPPPSPRLSSVAAPPPSPGLSSCHPRHCPTHRPLLNRRRPRLHIGFVPSLERRDRHSC